jgi:adenylate cyclase
MKCKLQLTVRVICTIALMVCFYFTGSGQSTQADIAERSIQDRLSSLQTGESSLGEESLSLLKEAEEYYTGINNNCGKGRVHSLRARLFGNKGKVDSATFHYLKAESLISESCEPLDIYYLYNSWSLLNEQMEEFENSLKLNEKAGLFAGRMENKTFLLNVLVNRANVLSKTGKHLEAIAQLKEVNRMAFNENLVFHKLISYQNIGAIFIRIEEYDSALVYLNKLEGYTELNQFPFILMDLFNNFGVVYQELKQYELAASSYYRAIELAKSNRALNPQLIYLSNYSAVKNLMGDYRESRAYLMDYVTLRDSLFNVEKFAILKNLESQYEYNKQREKIFELESTALNRDLEIEKARSSRNIVLFAFLGILMMVVGLILRLRYTGKANKAIAAEQKRSEELLLNILPAEVAAELKANGTYQPRNFDHVTVLFADIQDFTSLSGEMPASELVNELNEIFAVFDRIVINYGLEKIKTIGDAYMVADGIKSGADAHPENVISAALEMMNYVNSQKSKKEMSGKPWFAMRAGIHTGPVSAGIVGLIKFQYDIWGDTVNIASRMESASEPLRVNISEITYQLVKPLDQFVFENRGQIDVKGKGKMNMYFVS